MPIPLAEETLQGDMPGQETDMQKYTSGQRLYMDNKIEMLRNLREKDEIQ